MIRHFSRVMQDSKFPVVEDTPRSRRVLTNERSAQGHPATSLDGGIGAAVLAFLNVEQGLR